jgi:hypothetical protein
VDNTVLQDHGHDDDMQTLFDCYAVTVHQRRLKPSGGGIRQEFGRDYGTYFSILELIATGKTAWRSMI